MFARFTIAEPEPSARQPLVAAAKEAASALSGREDVVHAKGWMGFPFATERVETPDLRLVAVSAVAPTRSALTDAWPTVDTALGDGVVRFDIEGELVRAAGEGWGSEFHPHDAEPIALDEPVVVVITAEVHPQHLDAFLAAGGSVVAQAHADPAYLGGCTLASSSYDITSFSCWQSARSARKFGYGAGAHRTAMEADHAEGWHDQSTSVYATFRVLSAHGTLLGCSPFSTADPEDPKQAGVEGGRLYRTPEA